MIHPAWRAAVAVLAFAAAAPASAQGLIWNLPEDGTEVVYGGTLTQTDARPGGQEATMTWDRQLTIRSVGTQQVQFEGRSVPGRWIEFELLTGKATEQGIDPGPAGRRVYKVLVPEPAVTGKPADDRGIPSAFLPIVEGYSQVTDQPPQRLASNAFRTYPVLALVMNYKPNELTQESEGESADVPAGQFKATQYAGNATIESRSGRVDDIATLIVSPDAPFGLVRWTATVTRSTKDPNQPRDAYVQTSRLEEQMEAKAINRNAKSVLTVTGQ